MACEAGQPRPQPSRLVIVINWGSSLGRGLLRRSRAVDAAGSYSAFVTTKGVVVLDSLSRRIRMEPPSPP
jgi:hypothetical protein